MGGCNSFSLIHDVSYRFEGEFCQNIAGDKEQRQSDDEEADEGFLQSHQVVVAVAVISGSCNNIILSLVLENHSDALVFSDVEFNLFFLNDFLDHPFGFLHDVVVDGVVVEHVEIGGIDGNLYLVDKLPIVQINRLHGLGIYLSGQEEIGLGNAFAFQVSEESLVSGMFADQVNEHHAKQKYGCRNAGVFKGKGCSDLHISFLSGFIQILIRFICLVRYILSVKIKPTPGLV